MGRCPWAPFGLTLEDNVLNTGDPASARAPRAERGPDVQARARQGQLGSPGVVFLGPSVIADEMHRDVWGRGDGPAGGHELLSRLSLSFLINFAWQMSPRFAEPGQVSNEHQPVSRGLDRPCNKSLLGMSNGLLAMEHGAIPSPGPRRTRPTSLLTADPRKRPEGGGGSGWPCAGGGHWWVTHGDVGPPGTPSDPLPGRCFQGSKEPASGALRDRPWG